MAKISPRVDIFQDLYMFSKNIIFTTRVNVAIGRKRIKNRNPSFFFLPYSESIRYCVIRPFTLPKKEKKNFGDIYMFFNAFHLHIFKKETKKWNDVYIKTLKGSVCFEKVPGCTFLSSPAKIFILDGTKYVVMDHKSDRQKKKQQQTKQT